jgi:hypothetical protein
MKSKINLLQPSKIWFEGAQTPSKSTLNFGHIAEPKRGAIAINEFCVLGLLTEDKPQFIKFNDGGYRRAWVGVKLTDEMGSIGAPWYGLDIRILTYNREHSIFAENREEGVL